KIKIAALRMYTCCVERINYDEFFDKCSLPDTLNSWFLVAQLHVWMCLVRMRQEGREGKFMCRYIVHSMWEDVEQRSKIMGIDAIHRKEALKAMTETFYAAIFGYDEGILSDDCVLAAALWRNLFNCQCDDPQQLELLVEYVRKQFRSDSIRCRADSVDIAGAGVTQPEGVLAGSRREAARSSSALTPVPAAVMYRRPLQVAARCAVRAAASRGACAKLLEQDWCLRASAAGQLSRSSCLTQSRALHISTQVMKHQESDQQPRSCWNQASCSVQLRSVKETPQHSQEEVGAFTKFIEAMGFTAPLKYNKWGNQFSISINWEGVD
ncbi:hypothetical protein CCH79_00019381, partial [Gambusia affinis]